ncbi:MAG: HD domain-containing phosphohydrolase [Fimbriimonadaceae bacterium]
MIELRDEQLSKLYFAGVLKDAGCSNNSVARISKLFGGDDFLVKREVKTIDWTSFVESLKFAMHYTEFGEPLPKKLKTMLGALGSPTKIMSEVTEARCTRGAAIASMLGFDAEVSDAIQYIDEHWDGKGAPYRKQRDEIPLFAQILCLSQTVEVFVRSFGMTEAEDMLRARSGTWFNPDLVDVCLSICCDYDFLENLNTITGQEESHAFFEISDIESDVDVVCEAFALIIDAKSSFTAEHSKRVTEYAGEIANCLGLSDERRTTLRRAGLMHDIGKLGVPTSILEKSGKLEDREFEMIRLHPKFSDEILRRIPAFSEMAEIASAHHERLDGKGYWRGLGAEQLTLEMRILTVADVLDALTAKRPYRDAMSFDKAFSIMDSDVGTAFDADCVDAAKSLYLQSVPVAA